MFIRAKGGARELIVTKSEATESLGLKQMFQSGISDIYRYMSMLDLSIIYLDKYMNLRVLRCLKFAWQARNFHRF